VTGRSVMRKEKMKQFNVKSMPRISGRFVMTTSPARIKIKPTTSSENFPDTCRVGCGEHRTSARNVESPRSMVKASGLSARSDATSDA